MNILERIVTYKRDEEIPARMAAVGLPEIRQRALEAAPALDFAAALRAKARRGVLIAEIKRASPSKGLLCPDFDPVHLAEVYVRSGAAALSVLTDEPFFQGSLEILADLRKRYPDTPLLRKDFILHPYQVYEARAVGADAILLIAAALPDEDLVQLHALAGSLGMAALVEVHNREELARVLPLAPGVVGVNNRDLQTFAVSLETCLGLRGLVPPGTVFVAESGIHTRTDVLRLADAGVDAALVGEALVTAPDAALKIQEMFDERSG